MPTSTDSVSISSAESATPPKLTVEYFVPSVAGRQVFYNRSTSTVFGDGSGNPVNSIDSSKQALLPGQTATFANVTNYSRGINGLVVDVSNLPATPTATDFQFAIWNGTSSGGFVTLTTQPTIARIIGGGSNGSDRIKIEFGDNVMRNTWLRVTLLANANTGLASNDIFYFGNAVAEMNVDNLSNAIRVNSSDAVAVRQNLSIVANSVGITNIYDVNKDGRVNAIDVSIVRQNQATTRSLAYFTAPASLRISVIPGLNVGSAVPLFKSPLNMFNVDTVFSNVDLGTIATALLISRSSF